LQVLHLDDFEPASLGQRASGLHGATEVGGVDRVKMLVGQPTDQSGDLDEPLLMKGRVEAASRARHDVSTATVPHQQDLSRILEVE
jgi:hypothetical protein